jgi:hypothetical protein
MPSHAAHDLARYAPQLAPLTPRAHVDVAPVQVAPVQPAPVQPAPVQSAAPMPRDASADVTAILRWLVLLGFLGLLGMVLTSLS